MPTECLTLTPESRSFVPDALLEPEHRSINTATT